MAEPHVTPVGVPLLGLEPPLLSAAADGDKGRRYKPLIFRQDVILFPQARHVTVRSFATGQWLGDLALGDGRTWHGREDTDDRSDGNKEGGNDKSQEDRNSPTNDAAAAAAAKPTVSPILQITCTAQTNDAVWVAGTDGKLRCYHMDRVLQAWKEHPRARLLPDSIYDCGNDPIRFLEAIPPSESFHRHAVTGTASATSHATARTTTTFYALIQSTPDKSKSSRSGRVEFQLVQLRIHGDISSIPHKRSHNNRSAGVAHSTITPHVLHTLVCHVEKKSRKDHPRPDRSPIVDLRVHAVTLHQHLVVVVRQAPLLHSYRVVHLSDEHSPPLTTSAQWSPLARTTTKYVAGRTISCMNLDNNALALGMQSGMIHVWPLFVSTIWEYLQAKDSQSSSLKSADRAEKDGGGGGDVLPTLVYRSLHWHAHPVATLAFDDAGTLYSAGEESVLCTWPLASGTHTADRVKPTQVQPRLARAGISHIQTAHGRVLIAADDETCQLVWLHNQARLWRCQAWPVHDPVTQAQVPSVWMTGQVASGSNTLPTLSTTTRDQILLAGVSATAGQIVWYAPHSQQVTHELVVAPFNTTSRTAASDKPWPRPLVTHVATAGSVLTTVDVVPTENLQAGLAVPLDKHQAVGSLTTLKFWRVESKNATYVATAIVPSPHGPASPVDSLALSPSGRFCCTVSCGEDKSFRLWERVVEPTQRSNQGQPQQEKLADHHEHVWIGRYRVTIPAGFANQKVGAVCFSSDDSVLAMSFAQVITLWDMRRGALLTTLDHVGPTHVQQIFFLTSGPYTDSLVSFSPTGVMLQSPFGARGPSEFGWTWELPDTKSQLLSQVLDLDGESIVLALYDKKTAQTHLLVVGVRQGSIQSEILLRRKSRVIAMATSSSQPKTAVYVMTQDGSLDYVSLSDSGSTPLLLADDLTPTDVPRAGRAPLVAPLLAATSANQRKRPPTVMSLVHPSSLAKRGRSNIVEDEDDKEGTSTYVPQLRSPITLSFLGRHLQKK